MPQHKQMVRADWPRAALRSSASTLTSARADAEAIVRKFELPWPQHFDGKGGNGEIAQRFFVFGIPSCVLIDRQGNLRYLHPAPPKLSAGEELLAEKPPPTRK